jgi:hypothetical protein
MLTQHDAVPSMSEFWRELVIVAITFGIALALSWVIDAAFPRQAQASVASVERAVLS